MKSLLPAAWVLKTARGIVKVREGENVLYLGFVLYATLRRPRIMEKIRNMIGTSKLIKSAIEFDIHLCGS